MSKIHFLIKLLFYRQKKFYKFLYQLFHCCPNHLKTYEIAFVHKSASVKINNEDVNNERLEFLGDAIFDAIVSDYIYVNFMDKDEGGLSKLRAKIVNREFMNHLAKQLQLDQFTIYQGSNNQNNKNIYGNVFEAVIGALYYDKGYDCTKRFVINKLFRDYIKVDDLEKNEKDFKSQILEWCQKNKIDIAFETEEGLNVHENVPSFTSTIFIDNIAMGKGLGSSKKEAEQNAAKNGYSTIFKNESQH